MAKKKAEVDTSKMSIKERIHHSMIEMGSAETVKVVDDPAIRHWNSTGSSIIDMHIGQGPDRAGLPGGRIIDLHGPNSGGKTGFALSCIRAAQQAGGFGHYIASEAIDGKYIEEVCGVNTKNPDHWMLSEVSSLEGMGKAIEGGVRELYDADVPCVFVVDSVSALGTLNDSWQEKNTDDNVSSASGAKWLHNWFRRGVLYYLSGSPITLIMIRHSTASPRAFAPSTTTHGSSIDYHAAVRLMIYKSAMDKKDGRIQGHYRNINCIKSKVGVDGWKLQQPCFMGEGVDPGLEVVNYLVNEKVLKKAGAYVVIGDEKKYAAHWAQLYRENTQCREYLDQLANHYMTAERFVFKR